MTATAQVPITETYEDVRRLVCYLCHKFHKKYGGDIDELISEANFAFMSAYGAFDPNQGEFPTLLGTCIKNRLLDMFYRERRRRHYSLDEVHTQGEFGRCLNWYEAFEDTYRDFDVEDFAEELTDDAKQVLQMIFGSTKEVWETVEKKGGQNRNWRSAIREHLREMNWTYSRIYSVFSEICAALE